MKIDCIVVCDPQLNPWQPIVLTTRSGVILQKSKFAAHVTHSFSYAIPIKVQYSKLSKWNDFDEQLY